MSLHRFLTRLIWICLLPLLLLATYLAIERVRIIGSERDLEAANLAKNFATAIDQNLSARIAGLQILAESPHAKDSAYWQELYGEAQTFRESFGSHVVLVGLDMRMLFNTRVPFGTPLPFMPKPKGNAATPTALKTGKPAIGDVVFSPVANDLAVAIAVPVRIRGTTSFLLVTTIETRKFQSRLEQVALPPGWSLALLDSTGQAIARTLPGLNPATDADPAGHFVAKSSISQWSVELDIPRAIYREPLIKGAAALAITVLSATLIAALGGQLASRGLGRAVASLAMAPSGDAPLPEITEIAAARHLLDESAQALRELNAGLERRVDLRTAELETANRELEAFSYSVSHDLRAPLRSIDGFAKILQEDYADKVDDDGKDSLRRVRAASQRMGQLIDDLLNLSRLSRTEMSLQSVDISALAAEVAAALKQAEPSRNVVFDIAPKVVARGDKRLLAVVLENLISNAWKFTSKHPSARIEVGVAEKNGARAYFVRDDGAGFDMAHVGNLFTPFQRLHGAAEFPGTGIGLATVRRIVQRHGGTAWAEGAVEKGATFYFALNAVGMDRASEEPVALAHA